MTITMYGIPNCDTIKKAKRWLDERNVEYTFHDYRKAGVNNALIEKFFAALPWEQVVNKRGTTYRQLSDEQKANLTQSSAVELLVEHPAMIKRPILLVDNTFYLGFNATQYSSLFE